MAPRDGDLSALSPMPETRKRRRRSVMRTRPDGSAQQPVTGRKGGGKGGGGGGRQRTPVEAPNTLRSKSVARIIDLVSEGEIGGLVDGLKSVYLDGTPVQNEDGTYNFDGVELTERYGTADQTYMPGFPAAETEVAVGTQIKQASPVTRTISDATTDAAFVKIRVPALSQRNLGNGDLNGTSVAIRISVSSNGGPFAVVVSDTISGKTVSPYERQYRVDLPAGGNPWDVKVERLTADATKTTTQNDTFWSSYTRLVDSKLSYPHSAVMGLRVDAKLFGDRVPGRAYLIDGIKVRTPSNYDPAARTYAGIWDGTFTLAVTSNPAWVLYDLLVENRYGLGDSVNAAKVDKWSLYAIAQYCDEMVDDGFGGTEPRFQCNTVINTRTEAYNLLNAVASAFRGMIYWGAGVITATQDSPADAVKLVTPANVIGGSFNYEGVGLKARHSVVLVTWNDPDDQHKPHVTAVEDKDLIERFGWRVKQHTAYGADTKGLAVRAGRWILNTEANETETVSYRAGYDHADVRPGNLIDVADPSIAGVRMGGRVAGVSTDRKTVTLDGFVTLDAAETYTLSAVMPNGDIETQTITLADTFSDVLAGWPNLTSVATLREGANLGAAGGTTKTVTVETAFTEAPATGTIWIITATNLAPRRFRVIANRETEKGIFEISALLHHAGKYAAVEQNLILEDPEITILPSGPIPAPTDLATEEFLYRAGVSVKAAVAVSWTAPTDSRVIGYEVEVLRPNEADYEYVETTAGITQNILDTVKGSYTFRVRSVTGLGEVSQWATHSESLLGLLAPPGDPSGFVVNIIDGTAFLAWDQPADLDFEHTCLKFAPVTSGATWGGGVKLVPPVDGQSIAVAAMPGTYMIKHVDTSGVESANAAFVVSQIDGVNGLNAVATLTEHPTFAGVKTDVVKAGSRLQLGGSDVLSDWPDLASVPSLSYGLGGITSSGTYDFANSLDLGAVYTSRLTATIDADGNNLFNFLSTWTTLADVEFLSGTDPSQWSVNLQVRTTDDDPAGSPTWSAWQDFFVGDYTARAFEFRLQMFSTNASVTPRVTTLEVQVDMPDRTARAENVTANAAGEAVTFAPAFRAEPAIAIAGQDMVQGDYFTVTGKSATGFTVRFFDSGDVGVSRTFDWIANGYGEAG